MVVMVVKLIIVTNKRKKGMGILFMGIIHNIPVNLIKDRFTDMVVELLIPSKRSKIQNKTP